ncbi:hypothetical protein [Bradyrhizobium sp. SZCCHNS3002]|uniref:hypothetical protein n=1 Tax=Bradyrhizobium sp. SZCCHNS3002 TaxID=3057310 RepID=UPI0028E99E07|nr:hypothetical protein [Bradyrhizobium sp. SZCCHNS3002]
MSDTRLRENPIGLEDVEERVNETGRRVESNAISLRDTAKWIIGGIAVAAAGVIAGTSLSSLGTLGFGWQLLVAISAAMAGFIALGCLFASSLKVIVPPNLTLEDFADGKELPHRWKMQIERSAAPLLERLSITGLQGFRDYVRADTNSDGSPRSPDQKRAVVALRKLVQSTANLELQRLLFRQLTLETFWITPIVGLAFAAFAFVTSAAKEEIRVVPAVEVPVVVAQDNVALLSKVLGAPMCVEGALNVIVLGEWRSGVQDVVTVPKPSCPPVRLRLDHGRFSSAR